MKLRIMLMFVISLIAPTSLQAAEAGPGPRDQVPMLDDRIKWNFFESLLSRDWSNAQALLNRFPDLIHARDSRGHTPLMQAIRYFRVDILEWLIVQGVDVNALNNEGKTALMLALGEKTWMKMDFDLIKTEEKFVELLLAAGANLRVFDKKGQLNLNPYRSGNALPFYTQYVFMHKKLLFAGAPVLIMMGIASLDDLNFRGQFGLKILIKSIVGNNNFWGSKLNSAHKQEILTALEQQKKLTPRLESFIKQLLDAQIQALNGDTQQLRKLLHNVDSGAQQFRSLQAKNDSARPVYMRMLALLDNTPFFQALSEYDPTVFEKVRAWQKFFKDSDEYQAYLKRIRAELDRAKAQYQESKHSRVPYIPHIYASLEQIRLNVGSSSDIAKNLLAPRAELPSPALRAELPSPAPKVASLLPVQPKTDSALFSPAEQQKWEELVDVLSEETALKYFGPKSASPSPAPQALLLPKQSKSV